MKRIGDWLFFAAFLPIAAYIALREAIDERRAMRYGERQPEGWVMP